MNGVLVIPDAPVSKRERMAMVLDALAFGLYPDLNCRECRDVIADRCPEHVQAGIDVEAVNAATAAVEDARTDAEALAVYDAVLLGLVGAEGGAR